MRKIILSAFLLCSFSTFAQEGSGGMPRSLISAEDKTSNNEQAVKSVEAPDYEKLLLQDSIDAALAIAKPYMVSGFVDVQISLDDGIVTYLKDGSLVWKLKVTVPEAKGVDYFFNDLSLPEGVELFLYNENSKQIIGAFNALNTQGYETFIAGPIVGEHTYIELNIKKGVSIKDIKFSINKISAYYRGIEDLETMYSSNSFHTSILKPTADNSAPCNIDAVCEIQFPDRVAEDYIKAKDATVKISVPAGLGVGLCTGTLINNTGNSVNGECKPYLLTASHCDGANSRDDTHFSNWRFNFGYEHTVCDGTVIKHSSRQLQGADFLSRSNYPSFGAASDSISSMVVDFLLLELRTSIPDSFNAYLAGWNREMGIAFDDNYDFFIGYHHPGGNPKKQSYGGYIDGSGNFNQFVVPATHWSIAFNKGCTEPGSSGSGLFDQNGLLIGDLSGGGALVDAKYSKISYGWENEFDQTTFPAYAGAQSRLKDWLDPQNSGVMELATTKTDCSDFPTSIQEINNALESSIFIYPNPSINGHVKVKLSKTPALMENNIKISVLDIVGKIQKEFLIPASHIGEFNLDCSTLTNGIYIVNFSVMGGSLNKKIVIAK